MREYIDYFMYIVVAIVTIYFVYRRIKSDEVNVVFSAKAGLVYLAVVLLWIILQKLF